jgi:hypothetical protein
MASFKHNKIERSTSRVWKKKFLNEVIKECKAAGFDIHETPEEIVIGIKETDQIFLRALRGHNGWLTRYDQKLFDENYSE